jgi:flagella basal body P-ring formation protein FlgA
MMRTLILSAAAAALLLTSAGAAPLAPIDAKPKLKAQVTVTGSIVRVGDLIDNAGIIANVPIFRSPDLGSSGSVSAEAVSAAVRAHQLVGLDTGDISEVLVTRATRTIEPAEIDQIIHAALSAQYALGPAGDIAVSFDRPVGAAFVEPTAKGEPRVAQLNYDARTTTFNATVELPGHGGLRVFGHAYATVAVATVARPIERGEVLKQADVVIERRPRNTVGREVISDPDQAIGLAARNPMSPGRLLRAADLTRPQVVMRNETVTLIYQMPGIMLTVRGKATEGGAEGDTISVLNEQSKRLVQGLVVAPGRVLVANALPQLAANLPQAQPVPAVPAAQPAPPAAANEAP